MKTATLLKKISLAAATTASLGVFATSANALTLSSSSGTWSNTVGGAYVHENVASGAENQVRWGDPATVNGQSGLGFTGVGVTNFNPGDTFLVGTLRHFNNAIWSGTAASSTDLGVNLTCRSPTTSQAFNFTLAIDETPNVSGTCVYPSTVPCADKISFPNAIPNQSFNILGTNYTLELLGFSNSLGGTLVRDFISQEGGANSAYLYGRITEDRRNVPEPTTVISLLSLGVLGATALKRKKIN